MERNITLPCTDGTHRCAPVLDVADVVALEQHIAREGTPLHTLMERAGAALAETAIAATEPDESVVVLAGMGNNGGDGWVAAKLLADAERRVTVVTRTEAAGLSAEPARSAALGACDHGCFTVCASPDEAQLTELLASASLIVDAILGTGFAHDSVREPFATWIRRANAARVEQGTRILSADCPSGLNAQTGTTATACISADETVTMLVPKPGLLTPAAASNVGALTLAPLTGILSKETPMNGKAIHRCLHVLSLERSLSFYEQALGMTEIRRMGPDDGSWTNVFIGNGASGFQLELTWNRGRTEPYDNGGRDSHLAFTVPDFPAAHALHQQMGCICHENEAMGLYFIEDPDGCWLEILPQKEEFAPQPGVDVLAAMTARRSLRSYSGESVPDELLDRILRAGLLSASGRKRRPWELVVVRNPETLATLAACRDHGSAMLADADAAIVVLGNPEVADTWIEDCSIVMANMHLEASASGVGSCWIQGRMRTAADGRPTQAFVADLLGIPDPWQLEAILSIGMPAETPNPRTFDETLLAKVHAERFSTH